MRTPIDPRIDDYDDQDAITATWTPEQIAAVETEERRARELDATMTVIDYADFIDWWREHYPSDFLAMIAEWHGEE